jgi:hypothetical protein
MVIFILLSGSECCSVNERADEKTETAECVSSYRSQDIEYRMTEDIKE